MLHRHLNVQLYLSSIFLVIDYDNAFDCLLSNVAGDSYQRSMIFNLLYISNWSVFCHITIQPIKSLYSMF